MISLLWCPCLSERDASLEKVIHVHVYVYVAVVVVVWVWRPCVAGSS